jgi:homoserine kinase
LVTSLRDDGFAAVISGAGPSVVVLGTASELDTLRGREGSHFQFRRVGIGTGVTVG